MSSLLQEFPHAQENEPLAAAGFAPPVDIYEDAQKVVLKLETPGVKQEDLDIRVENNTLTVQGERRLEQEEKEENFHRIERRYGSFFRSFTLPNTVNPESIRASYEAGVLRIDLEKRAEAKPKQIRITPQAAKQAAATRPEENARTGTKSAA